jgi:post-segregation antitoxin (ccd killing protein)
VRRARALDLDSSGLVEAALEEVIINGEQARWLAENPDAIDLCNAFAEKPGLFGDAPLCTLHRGAS